MIIVDTTVWVDYLNGVSTPETRWLDEAVGSLRLGLTDISLCEVLQGLPSEQQAAAISRQLLQFEVCVLGGADLAMAAARHYRSLRARGLTVRKTIDCLIATYCILNNHQLLHTDRDFDPFEKWLGLKVIHPQP